MSNVIRVDFTPKKKPQKKVRQASSNTHSTFNEIQEKVENGVIVVGETEVMSFKEPKATFGAFLFWVVLIGAIVYSCI